jgi:hypothetical protein
MYHVYVSFCVCIPHCVKILLIQDATIANFILQTLILQALCIPIVLCMLDVGCWLIPVGCYLLDGTCWLLHVICWMLHFGYQMLDVTCWLLHDSSEILTLGEC